MNNKLKILVADNNPKALKYTAQFLQGQGYDVMVANSREEAEHALNNNHLHLAILDMRLNNDEDEKDRSGIYLAQVCNRLLPKIINTKFPSYQATIDALQIDKHSLPPAVAFVNKIDGLETLLEAVKQSIHEHIHINWSLQITFNNYLSFAQLLERIGYTPMASYFSDRLYEVEDLMRKLFLDAVQVTVDRVVKQRPEYVLICVYVHRQDQKEAGYMVALGHHEKIKEKWERYQTAVNTSTRINRTHTTYTTNLGAIAYQLLDGDIIHASNLADYYFLNGGQNAYQAVEYLLTKQFPAWHHTGKNHQPVSSVHDFYLQTETTQDTTHLLSKLCEELTITELGHWRYENQQIMVNLPPNGEITFANPFASLPDPTENLLWGVVHGAVDCESIQILPTQQAILIDFAQVQIAPILHDYTSLEVHILCYLTQPNTPQRTLQILTELATIKEVSQPIITEDPLLSLLLLVRHHTCKNLNCSRLTYLIHIIYNLRRLLLTYNTKRHYDPRTLAPYAIALLAAGFWVAQLTLTKESREKETQPFLFDIQNQHVIIHGKSIELTPQEYKLLSYMVAHENKLCTKKQLIEEGLGDGYDPLDPEQARLTSAISRLRQKIGLQFIQTVRGHGYKFIRKP